GRKLEKVMEAELILTTIGGSNVIGALLAMNSKGVVVTGFTEESELEGLWERLRISRIPDKLNAAGNNILVNDKAALIHPDFAKESYEIIQDTLEVEVVKGTISGLKTVGAAAAITNKGGLCHPKISESDQEFLQELFGVSISKGTANYGTPLIGACLIGNTKGAITGNNTTGIELGRIEDALVL
ncbi:MAG: translation initiation factor IF-6, partial [Thermoplasmata archaeon]|nr:translation initiation factor IF-6 [Thermoplasmata archaeon]